MFTSDAPTRVQQLRVGRATDPAVERRLRAAPQQRIVATGDAAAITVAFSIVMSATAAFGGIRAGEVVYTLVAAGIGLDQPAHVGHVERPPPGRPLGRAGRHRPGQRLDPRSASSSSTASSARPCACAGWSPRPSWPSPSSSCGARIYRSWLAVNRRQGRMVRSTLIVGTDARAFELVRIAEVHPEAGTQVVGIVGDRAEAIAAGRGDLWLAELADLADAVADITPDRIVVSSNDIDAVVLAELIRAEHAGGAEVVVHAGLPGFDASRVSVSTMANEALLHVESATPSLTARAVKRAFDIVVAGTLLLVASPVLAVVAILVKKEDRGPVFFRQQRVGRGDAEFGMLKFRTMCVDAEARLAAMQADNQRSGPLFKLARDPRVTRIGHVLRRTSLDELPQLLNVLKGDMSLVGPRPALRRRSPSSRPSSTTGTSCGPASPASGRSRPGTTRRSTPTSASTSTTSRTGRSASISSSCWHGRAAADAALRQQAAGRDGRGRRRPGVRHGGLSPSVRSWLCPRLGPFDGAQPRGVRGVGGRAVGVPARTWRRAASWRRRLRGLAARLRRARRGTPRRAPWSLVRSAVAPSRRAGRPGTAAASSITDAPPSTRSSLQRRAAGPHHRLDRIAGLERHRLDDRTGEVGARGAAGDADDRAPGVRIPPRRARAR